MLAHSWIATQARLAQDTSQQEIYDWARIYAMVGPGRKLDTGEAAQLREAIGTALFRLNLLRLVAPQTVELVKDTGLLDAGDLRAVDEAIAERRKGPTYQSICGPVKPYAGQVVDAPYSPSVLTSPK